MKVAFEKKILKARTAGPLGRIAASAIKVQGLARPDRTPPLCLADLFG